MFFFRMNLLVFIKFHQSFLITNEVCVMSSKILGIKASSYVRFQAGIDWLNMLQGATRILRFNSAYDFFLTLRRRWSSCSLIFSDITCFYRVSLVLSLHVHCGMQQISAKKSMFGEFVSIDKK